MKKVIVGGLLAGLVLFVWGWISHEILPLGEAGVRSVPQAQEEPLMTAMRGTLQERALYIFPGMDRSHKPSPDEMKAWQEKYLAGPGGIIAFDPRPGSRASGGAYWGLLFGTEFLSNLLAALVGATLIFHLPANVGYGRRVLLAAGLGLLAAFEVDASYWNWYGFPTSYFLAQVVDHTAGWTLAGLVLARIARP